MRRCDELAQSRSDLDDPIIVFRSHATIRRIRLLESYERCGLAVLEDPAARRHDRSCLLRDRSGPDAGCCGDAARFFQFARGRLRGGRPLSESLPLRVKIVSPAYMPRCVFVDAVEAGCASRLSNAPFLTRGNMRGPKKRGEIAGPR